MKLVTYLKNGHEQLAFLVNEILYDTDDIHPELPSTMGMFLNFWDDYFPVAKMMNEHILSGRYAVTRGISFQQAKLLAPLPQPPSCRDGYAFRLHVEAARRNRKVEMIEAFDEFPVFYFTNHHGIQGPGEVECMPDHFQKLDFELEAAIIISKAGRNIRAEDADEYIAGYMIMNDLSARQLQLEEMQLNLGPAKGKDFATLTGPCLVTVDELEAFKVPAKTGHIGHNYNLAMKCTINGEVVSEGNMADMDWTFSEIIERASYGVNIVPGDVIGSGTVGTGCFLELNGTAKLQNPSATERWLKAGDIIEMEIEALGLLQNTIVAEDDDFSILARKKLD